MCAKTIGYDGPSRLWKPNGSYTLSMHELADRLENAGHDLTQLCESLSDAPRDVSDLFLEHSRGLQRSAQLPTLVFEKFQLPQYGGDQRSAERLIGDADVRELAQKFDEVLKLGQAVTLSQQCQPINYRAHQLTPCAILDGRRASSQTCICPPIELFHESFAQFRAIAFDDTHQPPEGVIVSTLELMKNASAIATSEAARSGSTRKMLGKLLNLPAVQTVDRNKNSPDHVMICSCRQLSGTAALAIIEEKAELGTSGEGSVQGSFSYMSHWASPDQKQLVQNCSAPSFIISIAGPWLVVCGAIITSQVIVHRLTDYIWLGYSRNIDDARVVQIARIFNGIRDAVEGLVEFYHGLSPSTENQKARFFSRATSFTMPDPQDASRTTECQLRYLRPLKTPHPASTVFLAEIVNGTGDHISKVVVKFVERYGEAAHRALTEVGRAPKLLYHGDVWRTDPARRGCGPCKMVVMELVEGKTASDKYGNRDYAAKVPEVVRDAVRSAVTEHLHGRGLVHGDIRRPNILLAGEEENVMILDFDWAGREGEVRYPLDLSEGIIWAEGVSDLAPILKTHDEEMISNL
ncbi:uncharacterized protein PHACADRAFT_264967 [Phanerochaete carnosa HHB-10118-sp]|uniref:Protein kinase domain-containing protein n=1 Tax=Phanerochaete carnosa (strain HHB-10118-sp) TaxID=650164 RepID=K5WJE3_PHACS|nr:uncharacterized protein PHACADRAFT_264967 [Phanerochaete carnosa HHB-10118-sp]EKM50342.1 hypothetical protein PHACADRAFT_264967 [Phanerochaete carnosa HHB-10118-sp]